MELKYLEKAFQIAVKAHKGQTDKANTPYIFHPLRVAQRCKTTDEKIVALLHDTIKDTYITPEYLLSEGFSDKIVEAVLSVTKREDECYEDFVKRSKANSIEMFVKMHDLEDNMDISRLNEITEEDKRRLEKYIKAYRYLQSED